MTFVDPRRAPEPVVRAAILEAAHSGSYPASVYSGVRDPSITSLVPNQAVTSGTPKTVQVHGSRFDPAATVEVNQAPVATVFVSASQLTATINVSTIGTKMVTVRQDPHESNSVPFNVDPPAADEEPEL